jgi:nucleotidyltransferase/DNA polymerase involved in DNA repair
VVLVLSKLIKSAVIEKASIDEVYLDVTEEALKRLAAIEDDVEAFNTVVIMARKSSLAGEDTEEMKMSKSALRVGHAGTKKVEDGGLDEGPNLRDWFDQPFFIWNQDDKLLLLGAIICDELRLEVLKQLGYSCSGGVSHNKMLSKIASAMHKPNRQTLVPTIAVKNIMDFLPVNRVAGFGGKLGESLAEFGGRKVEKFSDLIEIGRIELAGTFGDECANWMINAANGIDHTPVEQRSEAKSIGCGKSYRQKNILPPIALQDGRVLHWLTELSTELEERVLADTYMHSRIPRQLTVGLSIAYVTKENSTIDPTDVVKKWHESQGMSLSKVGPICVGAVAISKAAHSMAVKAVNDCTRLNKPWNITYISLSASGFVPLATESQAISSFFRTVASPQKPSIQLNSDLASYSDDISHRITHDTNSDDTASEIVKKALNHSVDSSSTLKVGSPQSCDQDPGEGEDDSDDCNTITDIASFYNSHGKMNNSNINKTSGSSRSKSSESSDYESSIILNSGDSSGVNQEKNQLPELSDTLKIPEEYTLGCRQIDVIDNKDSLRKDERVDESIEGVSREAVDMAVSHFILL